MPHNFFTSYSLLNNFSSRQIKAVGTICDNRTSGADKLLPSAKDMKKRERGSYDFVCDGTVFIMKWNYNSIVNVASNFLTHSPVQMTSKRVKGQSQTAVKQPLVVHRYNESMGGVDLFDRLLSSYRLTIRGKNGGGRCLYMLLMSLLWLLGEFTVSLATARIT